MVQTIDAPKDKQWITGAIAIAVFVVLMGWGASQTKLNTSGGPISNLKDNQLNNTNVSQTGNKVYDEIVAKVLPVQGFQSKIRLGSSVLKLVENGVIDQVKFENIYKDRGGLPDDLKDMFLRASNKPILLTAQNANFYVNILWPVGLSNYMDSNKLSPVNENVSGYASTGGWTLGKEENGGAYFNKFKIVELTPTQEALATKIAQNTYRPCCNNSTFFQDCNHGSALLGMLQLGASQGLSEDELWREALAFNSFWFPQTYITNALYFKAIKNTDWENVDPKVATGKDFSSASGSIRIAAEVAKIPDLIPGQKGHGGGGSCGT